ncbi:hypothetical protein GCM10010145_62460 [Streptomyces ruber]|uniref:Uncharacterized protein n=3 Tax=Streptomyces TaxID=1883 RepID=A0A918EXZ2_9ACTN|nr:hypothetical protein GCM10010145_62460 [Streptomyces ruber]
MNDSRGAGIAGGQPLVEMVVCQGVEAEPVGLQPVEELDGDSDVRPVGVRCVNGVAAASGPAAGVAQDAPFGERSDDPGLVRRQLREDRIE